MNGSREDHPTPAGARPSCTGGIKRTNQPINQPTHVAGPGKIIPHTDRAGAPKGNTSQDLTPRRQAEPFRSTGAQRVSSDQTKVSMFPLSPRQVRAPERTTASASLPTRFSLLRCVCWLIHWLVGPRASEPPSRPLRGRQVSSTPIAEFGVQGFLGDRNALPPTHIYMVGGWRIGRPIFVKIREFGNVDFAFSIRQPPTNQWKLGLVDVSCMAGKANEQDSRSTIPLLVPLTPVPALVS